MENPPYKTPACGSTVSVDQLHKHCNDAQDSRKNQYTHSVIACRDITNFGDFQIIHTPFSHDTHTVIKGLLIQQFGKTKI
jgi:Mg2+/Co2+ transporter CorC